MNHIVAYIDNPGPREIRVVRQAFGVNAVLDPVLPFVSPPLDKAAIDVALERLPDDFVVFVQPSEAELPRLQTREVLDIVRQHPEWALLLDAFRVDRPYLIETHEFSRCWLVLVHAVSSGIPPGEGFVIDNYSRRVFPRRFVDVARIFPGYASA